MKNRILCVLLAFLMVLSALPVPVFAENDTDVAEPADTAEAVAELSRTETTTETFQVEASAESEAESTCNCGAGENEAHAATCPDYVCPNCGAAQWHETCPNTESDTSPKDFSESVGMNAVFDVETWTYFVVAADPSQLNDDNWADTELALEEITDDLVVSITAWMVDGSSRLWYRVAATENCTLPDILARNPWVFQDYLDEYSAGDSLILSEPPKEEATEPTETETIPTEPEQTIPSEPESTELTQTTNSGKQVGVTGVMPEGVSLSVKDVAVNAADYGIADAGSILAALDISLLDGTGAPWQPYVDEQEVAVTIDATKLGLSDGDVVTLHHNHEGKITKFDPYVVIGGKLTFWTDRFSIYVVSDLRVEYDYSTEVTANSTYTMKVGEKRVFWGHHEGGYRAVWQVTDVSSAINYTLVGKGQDTSDWAQWIEVEAKDVTGDGEAVILTFTVHGGTSQTFYLKIEAPSNFYIDDNAAESGCLVPTWTDAEFDASGVQYTWSRSDGLAVRSEALNTDGSVNISIDRGGVTNSRDPITYTVIAIDATGKEIGTASYEVLYGNEILNPSFEEPGNITGGYRYYYNGYPGLYWKTTAPGKGDKLLMDIEVCHQYGNSHGVAAAADGNLFVELNAENFGALYQDLLTTPNAELTWSFSHTKRKDSATNDIMYVVLAATEDAQKIVNEKTIGELLSAAKKQAEAQGKTIPENIPNNPEGFEFTHNEGTYRIWKSVATSAAQTAEQWKTVSGTYRVPQGQYLTRLFFASETTGQGSSTLGNMIDAARAGEIMSYRVEYYVHDELQSSYTESGEAALYSMQSISNLAMVKGEDLQITRVTVNGLDYPGDINNGLYVRDYGGTVDEKDGIVCRVYLDSLAITITKVIEVEDWATMSAARKAAVLGTDGLTASFRLYDNTGSPLTDGVSSVTIIKESAMGNLTALTSFTGLQYGTYTVKEDSCETVDGYMLSTSYSGGNSVTDGVKVTLSKNNLFEDVVCTNRYDRICGDLRVSKFVDKGLNENAVIDVDKAFAFTVALTGEIPATAPESYRYTIKSFAGGALPSDQDQVVSNGSLGLSVDKKLTFSLKHNQYIVIEALPVTVYTIEEADYTEENYLAPIFEGGTGRISADSIEAVQCYNTIALSNGDLQITKKVESQDSDVNIPKQAFAFTVRLTNAPNSVEGKIYSVVYTCDTNKGTLSSDGKTYTLAGDTTAHTLPQTVVFQYDLDDYVVALDLYDGLTATIMDLPPCGYYITEADYSSEKFGTTWTGSQTGTLGGQKVNGQNPVTALTCVNTYNVTTGELQITKNVLKEYSRDVMSGVAFQFTISPAAGSDFNLFGTHKVTVGETSETVAAENNKLVVTIPFTAEELRGLTQNDSRSKTLAVEGLPIGSYLVTEAANADFTQSSTSQQVAISSTPGKVTFNNTYKRQLGDVTIRKELAAGSKTDGQTFLFRVTGPNNLSMTVHVEAGKPVTIYDLPKGTYTVTELTDYSWRYTLTSGKALSADLMANASVTLTFTNQYREEQWLNDTDVEENTFTASSTNT